MRKLVYSVISLVGVIALGGCQTKQDGPQTVIVELAESGAGNHVSETDTALSDRERAGADMETETEESVSETDTQETSAADVRDVRIEGLSAGYEIYDTELQESDPILELLARKIVPEVRTKEFTIRDVQLLYNGEEAVPEEEITFFLPVEEDAQVILYRLEEEEGEDYLKSETLEVVDGQVSYQAANCGRWMILSVDMEQTAESSDIEVVSETDTE